MNLAEWVVAALLSLPAPASPQAEPPGARAVRLAGIGISLSATVDTHVMTGALPGRERRLWAAAAVATLAAESGYAARSVHAGKRLGDRGRSICLMQINRGNPGAFVKRFPKSSSGSRFVAWRALAGIDPESTQRCLEAGVWTLARMRAWCARRVRPRELLAATLSAYMHGSSCAVSKEGRRRARLARRLLASELDGSAVRAQ